MRKFGAFSSSLNPEELSLRVKGVGMALIPILIFAGRFFGFNFLETDLVDLITQLSTALAAIMILYGQIRSWIAKLSKQG